MHKVIMYTDGSCLGNPGRGGWAALLTCGEFRKELAGGYALTTNNRMELMAAIQGLEALKAPCRVELYSDSRYLCDAVRKGWLDSWLRRGWKKADKKEVLNKDLWQRLLPLLERYAPEFHWVEGHSGHPENELVDTLARKYAGRLNLPADEGFKP